MNFPGYGIDPADKGIGKAISYSFKYALLKTFCLETGDDPDQDQSSKYEPAKPPEVELSLEAKQAFFNFLSSDVAMAMQWVAYIADAKKMSESQMIEKCQKDLVKSKLAFDGWAAKQKPAEEVKETK